MADNKNLIEHEYPAPDNYAELNFPIPECGDRCVAKTHRTDYLQASVADFAGQ